MSEITLGTPITDEGIASVNFFNGRLLTGKDLSREQDARRLADQRLGRATGPGIGWGLLASSVNSSPAGQVQVTAGLGVSLSGQVLYLANDTTARLVPPPVDTTTQALSGSFGACQPLSGAPYVAGDGLFLLTLAPASKPDGTAPVLALDSVNARCNTDTWIEAVQLRLLRIDGWEVSATDPATVARFRNRIAYEFFASGAQAAAHAKPGTPPGSGRLEQMLGKSLSRCDVPLAVVYMVGPDIVFVEPWAVRRRLAADAASTPWSSWLGEKVQALAEAQLLQFQAHLDEQKALILGGPASSTLDWLPPAGFLPPGSNWQTFLGTRVNTPPMPLAPSDAPDVLAGALRGDAVELGNAVDNARFRVYLLSSDGTLLFARDARAVHAAEQVWLDGTRTGLPGVADLQTAIDQLRAGTCLHVVLRPAMNAAAVLAALPAGQDVTVCFEPGNYAVNSPLQLAGLGHVRVHGPGARLLNTAGECALRIVNCLAATVRDIAVEGGLAGTGKDDLGIGLNGALTVVDTPLVSIEGVSATCATPATGTALGAVGIVTNMRAATLGALGTIRLTVADNDVKAGKGQQGILCVNSDVARICRNSIAVAGGSGSLQRGIVVAGQRAGEVLIDDNLVRDVVRGIAVGMSESAEQGAAPLLADRVAIERNRVELQLAGVTGGGRYGIFVGNANSVRANGNHVKVIGGDALGLQLHGMRLSGQFGAQLCVRENLLEGVYRGIVFQPSTRPAYFVWAFQNNVALGNQSLVLALPADLNASGSPSVRAYLDHNERGIELTSSSSFTAGLPTAMEVAKAAGQPPRNVG